jgi:hypothetical protein
MLDGKVSQARGICQLEENMKHTASRQSPSISFGRDIDLET